jgi:hypothetical protein
MALMIAGFTALVFAGSYLAGRSARPDGEALALAARPPAARLPAASVEAPAESAVPTPAEPTAAPPAAQVEESEVVSFPPFDLGLLHPTVAADVQQAREVQARALDASVRAQEAAERARAGAPGTKVISYESGDVYEGEVREADGARHGVGVYTWANPAELDYAGEFVDNAIGLGVKRWSDGATFYGDRRLEAGHGVLTDGGGGRYEGAWSAGRPDGHGAMWNADGSVRAQGLWEDGKVAEAWITSGSVEASAAPAEAAAAGDETLAAAESDELAQPAPGDPVGGPEEDEAP